MHNAKSHSFRIGPDMESASICYESLFSMKLIKLEAFLSMILAYDPYIGNQLAADTTWHF